MDRWWNRGGERRVQNPQIQRNKEDGSRRDSGTDGKQKWEAEQGERPGGRKDKRVTALKRRWNI